MQAQLISLSQELVTDYVRKEYIGTSECKYKATKLKPGRRSIRKQRYPFQPRDTVIFNGKKYLVSGVQNYGAYIKLQGLQKPVKISNVKLIYYGNGFRVT